MDLASAQSSSQVDQRSVAPATESPSGAGSPWPMERTPGLLDAERAHRPVDASFVKSFKKAVISAAARDTAYLTDATELDKISSHPDALQTYYPLILSRQLPALPLNSVSHTLLDTFLTQGHPNMPLIHHIPLTSLSPRDRSGYLAYSMAVIGQLIQDRNLAAANSIWTTANVLIVLGLEVDNREARNVELLNAWALLATYGATCADPVFWQQMNITQGYVGTAARRLCGDLTAIIECMPAILLADVLRSIHYGEALSVLTRECLAHPTRVNHAALEIQAVLLNGECPPALELMEFGSLTALVALLARIHTFCDSLDPLSTACNQVQTTASPSQRSKTPMSYSLYVPLSLNNETRLVRRQLQKALELWADVYLHASPQDIRTLYHLCEMYLALPALTWLPVLAGYPPRLSQASVPIDQIQLIVGTHIRADSKAQMCAWRILESTSEVTTPLAPWLPIAVFYAALVVWRTLQVQSASQIFYSRKVLNLFRDELKRLCWPCRDVMIETLELLAS